MKLNAKKIVTLVLTAAIALSGALTSPITADAVVFNPDGPKSPNLQNIYDIENTTVTMKVGDTKGFELMEHYDGYSSDMTDAYDWTTSDETIVSMTKTYRPTSPNKVFFFTLRAEKTGTATITGTGLVTGKTISFTVTVKGATAKQKSCKHSWKTTKKATCLRSGVKTCKKCKLTKTIAKKQHKWDTYDTTVTKYDEYEIFMCNACVCEDPELHEYHVRVNDFGCENWCGMEFSSRDYGSVEAALEALSNHAEEYNHLISVCSRPGYENPHKETITVTECKNCLLTPEEAAKY